MIKSTVLPQAEAKESTFNMLAFLGLRLRAGLSIFNVSFLLKTIF